MNKNKNYHNEVKYIYDTIMKYNLTELIREANRLGVRTNTTNVYGMGMIIDDMMMWYVCGPVSRSTWMEPNVTGTLGTQGTLGEDGG